MNWNFPMAIVAALSFCLYLPAAMPAPLPQEPKPADASKKAEEQDASSTDADRLLRGLKKGEINKLRKDATSWFKAREKAREKGGSKAMQKRRKARDKFTKSWRGMKTNPFKFMGDVVDVFAGTFPYGSASISSSLRSFKDKDKGGGDWAVTYDLAGPARYRNKDSYGCLVVLPGETKARDYFAATWKKAALSSTNFFVLMPTMIQGDDYDPVPNLSKQAEEEGERKRIGSVLMPFGEVQRNFRLDRSRYILDCGKGNSMFGLRLATYFPSRFGGLILRYPAEVKKALRSLQLGSLAGVPVMLISSSDTAEDCKLLAAELNRLHKGACDVLEGKGEYPFFENQAEIDAWVQKVRRPLFPARVVIEANDSRFGKSHWVNITQMEPLETLALEERPRLEVTANRKTNVIECKARNVGKFVLSLNDALVDLDKEVSIIVNGKTMKKKFGRRLPEMVEEMVDKAFDPTHIYCAFQKVVVPKEEPKKDGEKGKDADAGAKAKDEGAGNGGGKEK